MRVLIIEDEKPAADNLEKMLFQIDGTINILNKIDSIEDSVRWLRNNSADLIFLDIHLADGLCFKIFEKIKIKTPIIFTTAYDQYAIKAFKVNSIDYLPGFFINLDQGKLLTMTKMHTQTPCRQWNSYLHNILLQILFLEPFFIHSKYHKPYPRFF